jgi:ATP-dependent helicase/nuclease subunit A
MSNASTLNDQRTRDRIVSELDKNLLVEAGAGSGKTHMMAARMAAGVASGAYAIEKMAAVTFTRKAAAELRGRFQLALESALAGTSDVSRANRLRSALSNLERFFAGTIHSFCAHLLRERPVEAGVSPGFTELEEAQDTLLRRQSWRDFRIQAKGAGDPLILELLDAGIRASDLDRAFDKVCLYEEVSFPPGEASCPEALVPWSALETFWAALVRKLPHTIPEETTCRTQQVARRFFGQVKVVAGRRGRPAALGISPHALSNISGLPIRPPRRELHGKSKRFMEHFGRIRSSPSCRGGASTFTALASPFLPALALRRQSIVVVRTH